MQEQREQYVEPDLKLVGGASDVVLGSTGIGFDFFGEMVPRSMEFETEDMPVNTPR